MDIYWIQDGKKHGPVPLIEILSMLESGDLSSTETIAWHKGCEQWQPLGQLPAVREVLEQYAPLEQEPAPPIPEVSEDIVTPLGNHQTLHHLVFVLPYPYVRLLARIIDALLFAILYFSVINVWGIPYDTEMMPGSYGSLLYICLPMILIEAVLLSSWGTTPGKALLGVATRDYLGNKLSFTTALWRSVFVMGTGVGFWNPGFLLFTLALSWWWARKIGSTPWDKRLGTTDLLYKPYSKVKLILVFIVILVCCETLTHLTAPWKAEIDATIQQINKPAKR